MMTYIIIEFCLITNAEGILRRVILCMKDYPISDNHYATGYYWQYEKRWITNHYFVAIIILPLMT